MSKNIVQRAEDRVSIRTALVSVSDKGGLDELVTGLMEIQPEIRLLSTGGTYRRIREILGDRAEGVLERVSRYTGQPETQGGLVKTLDFKIYLGLLTETFNDAHQADLMRTGAAPIDLVVCNLYPFQQTVAREGITVEHARANIDIGGPTMIRAAAKNFLRVAVLTQPSDYSRLIAQLREGHGALSLAQRFSLARKAFAHTAGYDAAIRDYLEGIDPEEVEGAYRFAD